MGSHLTEEEFSALLLGEDNEEHVYQHLKECNVCHDEVETLRRATADFGAFSLDWAEYEAARSVPPPTPFERHLGFRPGFGFSMGGAMAAICVLIAFFIHQQTARHPLVTSPSGRPSAAEVAMDNQWLQSMDVDLRSGPDNIIIPASEMDALKQQGYSAHQRVVTNE